MMSTGLMISLIFMVLILAFRPLASEGLNTTQCGTLLSNVLTLFVGIMLIVTANLEDAAIRAGESFDPRERDIISSLIFVANILVMGIPGIKVLSDGNVGELVLAKISNQFCNEEEKQKMAEMKDKLLEVRDQVSDAHGTLSDVAVGLSQASGLLSALPVPRVGSSSGSISMGHGGSESGPTSQPTVTSEESAAPASLRGEIFFAPGSEPRVLGPWHNSRQMAKNSDRAWA